MFWICKEHGDHLMVLATTENNPSEATRVASSHAGTDLGVEADGDLAAPLK
jgi:hypothetical protein